jgi:hypothetical protein
MALPVEATGRAIRYNLLIHAKNIEAIKRISAAIANAGAILRPFVPPVTKIIFQLKPRLFQVCLQANLEQRVNLEVDEPVKMFLSPQGLPFGTLRYVRPQTQDPLFAKPKKETLQRQKLTDRIKLQRNQPRY